MQIHTSDLPLELCARHRYFDFDEALFSGRFLFSFGVLLGNGMLICHSSDPLNKTLRK